jgi:glycosyltransferase involved in cell wall biosynthesis
MPGFKQYDELPVCYASADAFIHASTTEQWGLVVNEAMASGLPVLVSNRCGCAPDLLMEGINGFSFDPFNTEAIAQAMAAMAMLQEDRRKAMGEESRRIIANWGPERFGRGLHEAAACALRLGPRRALLTDRLLLRALICR